MVTDDSGTKFMYLSAYILKGLSKRHTIEICAGTVHTELCRSKFHN